MDKMSPSDRYFLYFMLTANLGITMAVNGLIGLPGMLVFLFALLFYGVKMVYHAFIELKEVLKNEAQDS